MTTAASIGINPSISGLPFNNGNLQGLLTKVAPYELQPIQSQNYSSTMKKLIGQLSPFIQQAIDVDYTKPTPQTANTRGAYQSELLKQLLPILTVPQNINKKNNWMDSVVNTIQMDANESIPEIAEFEEVVPGILMPTNDLLSHHTLQIEKRRIKTVKSYASIGFHITNDILQTDRGKRVFISLLKGVTEAIWNHKHSVCLQYLISHPMISSENYKLQNILEINVKTPMDFYRSRAEFIGANTSILKLKFFIESLAQKGLKIRNVITPKTLTGLLFKDPNNDNPFNQSGVPQNVLFSNPSNYIGSLLDVNFFIEYPEIYPVEVGNKRINYFENILIGGQVFQSKLVNSYFRILKENFDVNNLGSFVVKNNDFDKESIIDFEKILKNTRRWKEDGKLDTDAHTGLENEFNKDDGGIFKKFIVSEKSTSLYDPYVVYNSVAKKFKTITYFGQQSIDPGKGGRPLDYDKYHVMSVMTLIAKDPDLAKDDEVKAVGEKLQALYGTDAAPTTAAGINGKTITAIAKIFNKDARIVVMGGMEQRLDRFKNESLYFKLIYAAFLVMPLNLNKIVAMAKQNVLPPVASPLVFRIYSVNSQSILLTGNGVINFYSGDEYFLTGTDAVVHKLNYHYKRSFGLSSNVESNNIVSIPHFWLTGETKKFGTTFFEKKNESFFNQDSASMKATDAGFFDISGTDHIHPLNYFGNHEMLYNQNVKTKYGVNFLQQYYGKAPTYPSFFFDAYLDQTMINERPSKMADFDEKDFFSGELVKGPQKNWNIYTAEWVEEEGDIPFKKLNSFSEMIQ